MTQTAIRKSGNKLKATIKNDGETTHIIANKKDRNLLKASIEMSNGEFDILAQELTFVSNHRLITYKEYIEEDRYNCSINADLWVYKESTHSGDNAWLNRQYYYVRLDFNHHVWRLNSLPKVCRLFKLIRASMRERWEGTLFFEPDSASN